MSREISTIVTGYGRVPCFVTTRSATAVAFRTPCGLPECSGQRNPTGAGVMHS